MVTRPMARQLVACVLILSCHGRESTPKADAAGSHLVGADASLDAPLPHDAATLPSDAPAPHADAHESLETWLGKRLPEGGRVEAGDGGTPRVVHTVRPGDTLKSIAEAYVGVTDIYAAADLLAALTKGGASATPGARIDIPHIVSAPLPDDPTAGRLGWPDDRALRGVFITGAYAAIRWVDTLDKLAARGLNAVVLDGKDYQGPVNYPSKVPVAVETKAYVLPNIPDLARAIRFAHDRGIRVIMRIACFHDPWAAKRASRLSLMGNWGGPFPMGWLDPTNVETQDYIVGLVKEQLAAGADEIQLDYVRFPVQSKSINAVVMPKPDGSRAKAIRAFVRRVHEVTEASGVPLSLDIFGVTATGDQSDIDKLGQDIGTIGGEAEALSPMVYPSEYSVGYRGFERPGDHPEIVGIGTKAAVQKLKAAKNDKTIIRSWLQASSYKSTTYGPGYILKEAASATANGGVGWLLWSPGCDYWAAWRAFPVLDRRP
jgi:hypothetical protein